MIQQDIFLEKTVKRIVPKQAERVTKVTLVTAVICLALLFFHPVFLIGSVVFFILYAYDVNNLHIEYDYSYTNGEIDIVKVINGSRRKKLITFEQDDIEIMASPENEELKRYLNGQIKKIDCVSHEKDRKNYAMVVKKSENQGKVMILWEPGDEIAEMLKRFESSKVYL